MAGRLPLLLLAAVQRHHGWALQVVDADVDHDRSASAAGMPLRINHGGASTELARLRVAWISSQEDLAAFKAAAAAQDPAPVKIHVSGGLYGGLRAFTEALTQDLPEDLAAGLRNCSDSLSTFGGRMDRVNEWRRPQRFSAGHVWLSVNGETSSGEEFWQAMQRFLGPADKMVILGNWWNSTHESFRSAEVTSIWVPFASTSFAEREHHTPMDLVDRSRTPFGGNRSLVAYQQAGCNAQREAFWDILNEQLQARQPGLRGSALSTCNGRKQSGLRSQLRDTPGLGHMDGSVAKYENFRFIWSAEHGQNSHGYLTEKIVNAFLAGAVPIYAGFDRADRVFAPDSFLRVDMNDPRNMVDAAQLVGSLSDDAPAYEALLHRSGPLVSEAAMRRFFTWHPATWARYGDGLRRQALGEALRLCRGEP